MKKHKQKKHTRNRQQPPDNTPAYLLHLFDATQPQTTRATIQTLLAIQRGRGKRRAAVNLSAILKAIGKGEIASLETGYCVGDLAGGAYVGNLVFMAAVAFQPSDQPSEANTQGLWWFAPWHPERLHWVYCGTR